MREIKFRFWKDNTKEMLSLNEALGFLVHVSDLISGKYDNFKPLQYTGLKGKDDKEIFERDIVKTPNGKLHVVRYNHGGFEPVMYYENKTMTILGNIYENPELMEGS